MNNFWRVQLTDMAEIDLIGIKIWTTEKFGAPQAAKYLEVIASALEDLMIGPKPIGSKPRKDIGPKYSQPACAAKRQQRATFAGVQRSKKSNHLGFTIAARQYGFETSLTRIKN